MRKTKTRLLSLLMLLVMLFGMLPTAYADPVADLDVGEDTEVVNGFGASYATADAEPAEFTIIVPTKLPFAILKDGQTLKATNAAIKNRSNGPVTLDGISAEGKGWAIVPEDTDFNAVPVNSRQLTLKLNNDQVPAALPDTRVGVPMTQADWSSPGADDGSIYGQSDLPFTYDGSFAPQSNASEEAVIAHVIFTIAWKYDDAPFVIGDILDFYTFVILDDGTLEITGVKEGVPKDAELPSIPAYIEHGGKVYPTRVADNAFGTWPGKTPRIYSGTGATSGTTTGGYTTSGYTGDNFHNVDPSTTSLGTPTTTRIKTSLPSGTKVTGITSNGKGGTMSFPGGASYGVVDKDGYLTTTTTTKYPGSTDYTFYYVPSGGSTGTGSGSTSSGGGTPQTQHATVHYPITVVATEEIEKHPTSVKSYGNRLLIELPVGEKHNGARTYSITSEDPTIADAYEVEDFVVTNGVYKYWLVPHKEGDVLITIILTDGTMLRDHVMIRNSTTAAKNGNKYTISVPNEYEGKTVKRFVLTDPELADVSVAPGTVVKNGQFEVTVNPKKNGHCEYIVEFTDGTSVRSNSQLYINLSNPGTDSGDNNHGDETTKPESKELKKPETPSTVNIGVGEMSNYIKSYNGPTFVYDGQSHFPTFSFAEGTYKLSRTSTAQTAVGKYVTVIEPADGYKWSDGTTDKIACVWNIVKSDDTDAKLSDAGKYPQGTVLTGGTLLMSGSPVVPGDQPQSYDMGKLELVDSSTVNGESLRWIKVSDKLYICDRNMLSNISVWDIQYNTYGLGRTSVIIDGYIYQVKLITTSDWSSLVSACGTSNADNGYLNDIMHWKGYYTLTSTYASRDDYYYYCGNSSASYVDNYHIYYSNRSNDICFRPALIPVGEATNHVRMPSQRTLGEGKAIEFVDNDTYQAPYNYRAMQDKVAISEDAESQIDPGEYQTTYTPKSGYVWADGTSSAITVYWKITEKPRAVVTKAPVGKILTGSGSSQVLITAGEGTGGTIYYKVDDGEYSTTVPSATNPGTYTIYYKVVGDKEHRDSNEGSVITTITGDGVNWTAEQAKEIYTYSTSQSGVTILGLTSAGAKMDEITEMPDFIDGKPIISLGNNTKTGEGYGAFYNSKNMALTSLPKYLITISPQTFYGCKKMAVTSLPSTVTSIGEWAFYNCANVNVAESPCYYDNESFMGTQNPAPSVIGSDLIVCTYSYEVNHYSASSSSANSKNVLSVTMYPAGSITVSGSTSVWVRWKDTHYEKAYVTPKAGYCWADGTTTKKEIKWYVYWS